MREQSEAELRVLAGGQATASRLASVVESLRKASAESETHRVRVATLLADYLEGRRLVYSLKQWKRGADDLHGPLDGQVLESAAESVLTRLTQLAEFLRGARGTLQELRDRYARVGEGAPAAAEGVAQAYASDELAQIDHAWRRASESVTEGLRLYQHYLGSARRIAGLASGLMPVRYFEPLDQRLLRKLLTLAAQPLQ